MPIRTSSARHVDALINDLRSTDAVTRDAAVARLTVIGARAVDRLLAVAGDTTAPSVARAAAFRALEGIADPRTLAPALEVLRRPLGHRHQRDLIDADDDVAIAAAGVARGYLQRGEHVEALDALTSTVLDRQRSEAVRVAALRALDTLDAATLRPVREALLTDASPRLRAFGQGGPMDGGEATADGGTWLDRPDDFPVPDDPDSARHDIERRGTGTSLALLHRALERVRDVELNAPARARRGWRAVRMAIHVVLAHKGSRVALYDLRELLEAADGPVAAPLLTAVGDIGDASCLEPLAELLARGSSRPDESTSNRQVAEAFQAIVLREGVTARHGIAKKIKQRWPAQWPALWPHQR